MPGVMIEGVDGTGKSTLAEEIADYAAARGHKVQFEHYGVPSYDPDSPLTIGEQAMNQLMIRFQDVDPDTFVVLDRFHWGEPAYAPVFRPQRCVHPIFGTLQAHEFTHVNGWVAQTEIVPVYCTAPLDVMLQRLFKRGEEELLSPDETLRSEQILKVRDNYQRLLEWLDVTLPAVAPVTIVELLEPIDTFTTAQRLVQIAEVDAPMFAPTMFEAHE